jgi:hypothetical protein
LLLKLEVLISVIFCFTYVTCSYTVAEFSAVCTLIFIIVYYTMFISQKTSTYKHTFDPRTSFLMCRTKEDSTRGEHESKSRCNSCTDSSSVSSCDSGLGPTGKHGWPHEQTLSPIPSSASLNTLRSGTVTDQTSGNQVLYRKLSSTHGKKFDVTYRYITLVSYIIICGSTMSWTVSSAWVVMEKEIMASHMQ